MTIWTELSDVPFAVEYVDAGGLRTRALRAGSGEPIIMLHGTSGHLEAFVRNVAVLSEHYDCHAVDMMGHGYTDSPQVPYRIPGYVQHVLDYLDAQGIESAHFIGESLGGWVAGRLAADHPERVRTLALVAAGGTVANPEVMERIKASTRRAVMTDDRDLTRARLELLMHDPVNVTEELVDVRHTIYHRPSFVENIDHLLCLQEMENRTQDLLTPEQMGRITAPTRVVWGAENPFGDVPEARAMSAAIPGSELAIYPECGHWPQHEHADRFNKETLEFLAAQR
ncbi:alpha/beta fold hydrolase [Nocardioides massiliensis]|uniref:2-hydroxy-6-oxonona-2,4-dienedioate hydrolase n=1 Tax=Nocardioides massiliensis TaxID=1325935 RepID=A0ABT9NPP7_9ACTN|nr:alpha/beta fold hydrolase [Nocardioides massiliensis]MDP9821825.1 2-hydroxy-6-oxonona-2,4-dienedioate hydrolase [Nocardioides massiliensis]